MTAKYRRIPVPLSEEERERLEQEAARNCRSLGQEVRVRVLQSFKDDKPAA